MHRFAEQKNCKQHLKGVKISLNQTSQGFSVFRLLISAIMGLLILLIILGVAQYFYDFWVYLGYNRIVERFEAATNKADGEVLTVDNAELAAGTQISALPLSQKTGIPQDCISISGAENSSITYYSEGLAEIKNKSRMNVYLRCNTNFSGCETYCEISLGKKLG